MSLKAFLSLLFITLILFTSCTFGDEDTSEEEVLNSNVVVLDSSNYDQVIADNPYVLVEVYAPWCGHCKHLAPHYEEAANTLKQNNSPVVLAKLDGSQESERSLVSKLQVKGFPTLIFYKHGASTPYTGQRTAEDIVAWVTKKSGPATITLSDVASYHSYIETNPNISVVGYFENGTAEYQVYSQVAGHPSLEHITFAITTLEPVATQAGLTLNQIGIKRSFDSPITHELSNTTAQDLINYFNKNLHPYLQPAYISWSRLREQEVPIGIFIYNETDDSSAEHVKTVTEVAKTLSGVFGFATVGAEYLERSTQLGGSGKKLPTIVAVSPIQLNYPLPDETEFTREAIESWARGIVGGSIRPHFKSEPVPEQQEGAVYKLVGSTFESVVLNTTKDAVLVEFYAPWCGHCKNLEPVWNQLAEHYETAGRVLVAKLDSTANDNPAVAVSGYPSIYLFVSGNSTPIEYNGGRDLDSLISFVDANLPTKAQSGSGSDAHEEL